MNREDIIRMAQECDLIGMRPHLDGIYQESLERFAALVAAAKEAEFMDSMTIAYMDGYEKGKDAGAIAEREACAKVVDENAKQCGTVVRLILESNAAAIRARSKQ